MATCFKVASDDSRFSSLLSFVLLDCLWLWLGLFSWLFFVLLSLFSWFVSRRRLCIRLLLSFVFLFLFFLRRWLWWCGFFDRDLLELDPAFLKFCLVQASDLMDVIIDS